MLNISSYNHQSNVTSFRGIPRPSLFNKPTQCSSGSQIPVNHLSEYRNKIVDPLVKRAVNVGGIPSRDGKQVTPKTTLCDLLKNKCPFLRRDSRCNIPEDRPQACIENDLRC